MTVYYVFIGLVFIFTYMSQASDRVIEVDGEEGKQYVHSPMSTFWFFFIVATMVIIAGFRYQVGSDFGAYYKMYEQFAEVAFDKIKSYDEPGFFLLCWVVVKFGGNGVVVILLSSLITYSVAMFTLYKKTHHVLLFTLLYVFLGCWHEGFNAVRQCLALAFIVLGYKHLKERNFVRYLILIIIAGAFHRSALIMIVLYFLVNRKITFWNIVTLLAGCIVVLLSFDTVFDFSETLLEANYDYDYGYITSSVNVFRVMVAIAPAAFFLYLYKDIGYDKETSFHMNILLLQAAIMIGTSNSTYFARLGMYIMPFVAVAIPELLKVVDFKKRRIITSIIVILYFFFWWYELQINPALNDFHFVWEPEAIIY